MPRRAQRSNTTDRAVHRDASTGRFVPLPPSPAHPTYTDPDFAEYVAKATKRIAQCKARLRRAS